MPDDRRVILITGTRKGIGRSLVEYYANRDFRVVGCSRDASDFEHPNYRHFEADVSDEKAVKQMFTAVRHDYGGLDILDRKSVV